MRDKIQALLGDIEAMQLAGGIEHFYGPFSDFEHDDIDTVCIEWPNLTISAKALQSELDLNQEAGYTMDQVDGALCAWEHVLSMGQNEAKANRADYWSTVQTAMGACALRSNVGALGQKIANAYNEIGGADTYDDCFDWQFVPEVIDQLNDPIIATQADVLAAAKAVVETYKGRNSR